MPAEAFGSKLTAAAFPPKIDQYVLQDYRPQRRRFEEGGVMEQGGEPNTPFNSSVVDKRKCILTVLNNLFAVSFLLMKLKKNKTVITKTGVKKIYF